MNQMSALDEAQFDAQVQLEEPPDQSKSRKNDVRATGRSEPQSYGDKDVRRIQSASECLFCNTDLLDVENNLEHMQSVHGLYIPAPDQLSDIETFLGYLASIICDYNECLYCGAEKNSLEAVQTHMRDKGHCMISLDSDSELLDFWDVSDDEDGDEANDAEPGSTAGNRVHVSATEMRLPSGSIITSRSDTAQLRAKPTLTKSRIKASQVRIKRDEMNAIMDGSEKDEPKAAGHNRSMRTQPGTDRRVAVRGEMGLIGLPEQQKRALMATEVKMKKREHIAKAAQRWATEKVANKQKFFKVSNVTLL